MAPDDARTERLVANRRAAAAEKQSDTLAAIDQMLSNGDRINFVEVQRAAAVSTWFVYNNRTVRRIIEAAMDEQRTNHEIGTGKSHDDRTSLDLASG